MSNSIVSFDLTAFPMDMLLEIIFYLGVESLGAFATTSKTMYDACVYVLSRRHMRRMTYTCEKSSVKMSLELIKLFGCVWSAKKNCRGLTWGPLCDFHRHQANFICILVDVRYVTMGVLTRIDYPVYRTIIKTQVWTASANHPTIDERLAQAEKDGHVYTLKYYLPHRPCPQTLKNGCCSICKR